MNSYSYIKKEGKIMTVSDCGHDSEHEARVRSAKENMPSEEGILTASNVFRVLGDPSRLKILLALMEGELCVYHIVEVCGGNQSAVSQQLRVLKDNRIVKSRREGQNILYSIADEHIRKIIQMSEEHLYCKF